MTNYVKYFFALIILSFIISSCSDNGDGNSPIINLTSPAFNSTYAITDTIPITGTVTDETQLKEIKLSSDLGLNLNITNFDSPTSHVINYSLSFDPSIQPGPYNITIEASDIDDNTSTTNVGITLE